MRILTIRNIDATNIAGVFACTLQAHFNERAKESCVACWAERIAANKKRGNEKATAQDLPSKRMCNGELCLLCHVMNVCVDIIVVQTFWFYILIIYKLLWHAYRHIRKSLPLPNLFCNLKSTEFTCSFKSQNYIKRTTVWNRRRKQSTQLHTHSITLVIGDCINKRQKGANMRRKERVSPESEKD